MSNTKPFKRVTLKDIAEKTGYSVTAVSHALKDMPEIKGNTVSRSSNNIWGKIQWEIMKLIFNIFLSGTGNIAGTFATVFAVS